MIAILPQLGSRTCLAVPSSNGTPNETIVGRENRYGEATALVVSTYEYPWGRPSSPIARSGPLSIEDSLHLIGADSVDPELVGSSVADLKRADLNPWQRIRFSADETDTPIPLLAKAKQRVFAM